MFYVVRLIHQTVFFFCLIGCCLLQKPPSTGDQANTSDSHWLMRSVTPLCTSHLTVRWPFHQRPTLVKKLPLLTHLINQAEVATIKGKISEWGLIVAWSHSHNRKQHAATVPKCTIAPFEAAVNLENPQRYCHFCDKAAAVKTKKKKEVPQKTIQNEISDALARIVHSASRVHQRVTCHATLPGGLGTLWRVQVPDLYRGGPDVGLHGLSARSHRHDKVPASGPRPPKYHVWRSARNLLRFGES